LALEDKVEGIWFAEAFVIADEEALMSAASSGVRLFIITPTIAPLWRCEYDFVTNSMLLSSTVQSEGYLIVKPRLLQGHYLLISTLL